MDGKSAGYILRQPVSISFLRTPADANASFGIYEQNEIARFERRSSTLSKLEHRSPALSKDVRNSSQELSPVFRR
jgi:hypothetical protein